MMGSTGTHRSLPVSELCFVCVVCQCSNLRSLAGLSSFTSVNSVELFNNRALLSLDGSRFNTASQFYVAVGFARPLARAPSRGLASCFAINSFDFVCLVLDFAWQESPLLTSIAALRSLTSCVNMNLAVGPDRSFLTLIFRFFAPLWSGFQELPSLANLTGLHNTRQFWQISLTVRALLDLACLSGWMPSSCLDFAFLCCWFRLCAT